MRAATKARRATAGSGYALLASLAAIAAASCEASGTGAAPAREPAAAPAPGTDQRGAFVAPLKLELWATTRGTRTGPLADGVTLASGDRIEISARTASDAHVSVFFCDSNRQLTRHPKPGPLPTLAGQERAILSPDVPLTLDQNVGKEAVYVVASREPLAPDDPKLDAALAGARPGDTTLDCGEQLERAISAPKAAVAAPPKGKPPPKPSPPKRPPPSVPKPQAAELVRGAYVENRSSGGVLATSNEDGIVVLRYGFEHR